MNCWWRNECNESNVNIVKCKTVMKGNFTHTCKDFYKFLLKEKDPLISKVRQKVYF